jgi:hypothetical protein
MKKMNSYNMVRVMVFNATFNSISVISYPYSMIL